MKYLNILIVTTVLFSEFAFCKSSGKGNQTKQSENKKVVFLKMFPAPSRDMLINIVDGTPDENSVIIPKGKDHVRAEVKRSIYKDDKGKRYVKDVTFYILPESLHEYLKIPKNARKNYNPNDELPRTTGEERLMQALATSVSYDYDTLPREIALPNPMEILHDILDCNC